MSSNPRSIDLLGVRVDDVTYAEALGLIERYIEIGGPHAVVTPNPEIVMLARRSSSYRQVLGRAALAIPDGIGLILAARWKGNRFREHVRGTDLVLRLAERSESRGWRWFLLGAADGVAAEAASWLKRRWPQIQIAGSSPGSPSESDDAETRALIEAAGPVDIVLVAYGAPAQELWMDRNLGPLGISVGIGVGGVLDYLAGRVPRAPVWMQRLELEFLHRLVVQPWRWRRQLALPQFALLAAKDAVQMRLAGGYRRNL